MPTPAEAAKALERAVDNLRKQRQAATTSKRDQPSPEEGIEKATEEEM